MTRRSGRARIDRADGGPDHGGQLSRIPPAVDWNELSPEEQLALKRLNRGHDPGLDPATAERLLQRGLAARRPQGIGISRAGRELVINVLLRPEG
jgi:hypothetical protein